MLATVIFGKRKTRLGSKFVFEECRTRQGSAARILATANGGKRNLMPCDGRKESVSPGLATNNQLKTRSLRVGRNYYFFVVVFLARVSPRVASMLLD